MGGVGRERGARRVRPCCVPGGVHARGDSSEVGRVEVDGEDHGLMVEDEVDLAAHRPTNDRSPPQ
eukprot:3956848-Alexandrium_andersonii.AAC.1